MSGGMNPYPILIAAGGTGGHVFPALVVAQELLARQVPVVWIGTKSGLESTVVPAAEIDIEWMDVVGLRGKNLAQTLIAPIKLAKSLIKSVHVMTKHKPRAVLGMGGFVAGPVGFAACILRKPLILHEQNAVAGMTNRYLSHIATRVLQAFPGAFNKKVDALTVGNPVRIGIAHGERRRSDRSEALNVLVVGGSLGARFLNETMPSALKIVGQGYRVWHQTGKNNGPEVRSLYDSVGWQESSRVDEFIDDMSEAYMWADVVICRSGAMTVSELAIAGLPSILIPYPFAVDDHQTKNAEFLADSGAALVVQQQDTNPRLLAELLTELNNGDKLEQMSRSALKVAVANAGEKVVDIILEVAA